MPHQATRKILRKAQRRLWVQGLIDRGSLGLMLAACVLAICAGLHTLRGAVPMTWWASAALLAIAAPVIMAALDMPSPGPAAATVDRWLATRGLFSAVWFLNSQTTAPTTTSLVVREQAERVAAASVKHWPGLKNPFTPMRTAITVTVAAVSLFILSLQGAVRPFQSAVPAASGQLLRSEAQADSWVSALEDMAEAGNPVAGDRQTQRNASGDFTANSGSPRRGDAPGANPAEPSESGSVGRSSERLLVPGQGKDVGQTASMEPSRGSMAGEYGESDYVPGELKILNVPRKPAAQTTAVDRAQGTGLLPVQSVPQGLQFQALRAAAARPVSEPFALALGPAQRALQIRYFNEAAHGD
jgi:hypothetical protein